MRNIFIALVWCSLTHCVYASESWSTPYQDKLIKVQLQIGHEQHLVAVSDTSIKVGIPESLGDKLSVTTIGAQVWLLAKQNFDNEKIIFKTPTSQIVLQLSASKSYPPGQTIYLNTHNNAGLANTQATTKNCDVGMVTLVRYALQWAYSPRRLLRHNPCINTIDYPKNLIAIMNCFTVNKAICGGGVVAKPIAAWRTTKLYISLLELKNTLQTSVFLDPRALAGNFKAATIAHHKLGAADSAQAVTALVVISDKPLQLSLPKERWLDNELSANHPATP